MDTSGNFSTTNQVSFIYVPIAVLTVETNGNGTISPNYNGESLAIGNNYAMTATAAKGFKFTGWTDSSTTNGATLEFVMASNLVFTANFMDVTKPTLTITAPKSGQHLTNALANVTGTAGDNWKVSNVWYQLNGNVWSLANTTNVWTNWWIMLPLVSGTNTVKAYAMDLGGNFSTTNSVSFVSSNTFQLELNLVTQPLQSNALRLQISPGITGTIQVSTDLVNWQTLTNFVGTNPIINFHDAAATNFDQRFYRAVVP